MGIIFSKFSNQKNKQDNQELLLEKKEDYKKKEAKKIKFKNKTANLKKSLEKNEKIQKETKNKDLTIILGYPKSGKSTLTNYLLGSKFEKEKKRGFFKPLINVKKGEDEFSKINNDSLKSEIERKFNYFENENFNLLDTLEFFYSGTKKFQINFFLLFLRITQNCRNNKFIFTIDYYSLINGNEEFEKILFFIEKLFVNKKNLEIFKNCIMLLITKVERDDSVDIKESLLYNKNEIVQILKNRIFFYDPLDSKKKNFLEKQNFIDEIKNMKFVNPEILKVPMVQKNYFDKIFQYYYFEIMINSKMNQNKEIKSNYQQLKIFENIKNDYFVEKINNIDHLLVPYLKNLELFFKKFCDSGRFDACCNILNDFKYFSDKKEKFDVININLLEKLLENKKKKYKKLKEKKIEKIIENEKEEGNEQIKNLKKELREKKEENIKNSRHELEIIENEMKICLKEEKYEKLEKYEKYSQKKKLYLDKLLKDLEENYNNKIEKIQNPEKYLQKSKKKSYWYKGISLLIFVSGIVYFYHILKSRENK